MTQKSSFIVQFFCFAFVDQAAGEFCQAVASLAQKPPDLFTEGIQSPDDPGSHRKSQQDAENDHQVFNDPHDHKAADSDQNAPAQNNGTAGIAAATIWA